MGGLARICKMYGGMKITSGGNTVNHVWDYVADKAVPQEEMPVGSDRWKASEQKKWAEAIARDQDQEAGE